MEKMNPIVMQKDLNGYLLYSFPLCIVMSLRNGDKWYLENYFDACSYMNEDEQVNMEILDGISYGKFLNDMGILKFTCSDHVDDIVLYIKQSIDNGEWVILFIRESARGIDYPFLHEILIYGYNEHEVLYSAFNSKFEFIRMKMSIDNVRKAYIEGYNCVSTKAADWAYQRRVITVKSHDIEIKDRRLTILKKFQSYKMGKISNIIAEYNKREYMMYHGISNSVLFCETIRKYNKDYLYHIPFAGFHMLFESKCLLKERIEWYGLLDKPQTYDDVVNCFRAVCLQALKDRYLSQENLQTSRVLALLRRGYALEKRVLR